MNVLPSSLPDVLILEPKIFGDERGLFYESYNERDFAARTGIHTRFVQDNHSRSVKNVLRGLHYQIRQPQEFVGLNPDKLLTQNRPQANHHFGFENT